MLTQKAFPLGMILTLLAGPQALRAADEPKAAGNGMLIVVDANDKEHKLKTWRFVAGVRPLPGKETGDKVPPDPEKEKEAPKKPAGPLALELRETNSTTFRVGIVTLIPLDRIRSIDYDTDMKVVNVTVAKSDKADDNEVLKGSTEYKGINKLTLEAEVDLGDLGVGEVKFQGGALKGGIKSVKFPAPKPPAKDNGKAAEITATDAEKTVHKVADLKALYRSKTGDYVVLPTLMFKKTVKIDLGKIQKLRPAEGNGKEEHEFEITLADGKSHTLTLVEQPTFQEGQPLAFQGLYAKVPGGFKLFPVHTLGEVNQGEPKPEK